MSADAAPELLDGDGGWLPAQACDAAAREAGSSARSRHTISMSGTAFVADASLYPLPYATVTFAEVDGVYAVTDEDGYWSADGLPAGSPITPIVTFPNDLYESWGLPPFKEMAVRTFTTKTDTDLVFFQSVPESSFYGLAALAGFEVDEDACQVFSTVAEPEMGKLTSFDDYYFPHGLEDAKAALSSRSASWSPVYFGEDALPDLDATRTSVDGGVLWGNVEGTGSMKLQAKEASGAYSIGAVKVTCASGRFINASPPHSLLAE